MRTFLARFTARDVSRWALVLAALYLIGWMIVQAMSALIPFIFGAILAYLFLPLVNQFNPHMPRWAAILLVYLIVLGFVATFFAFLVPPLVDQVGQLIRAIPDIQIIQRWVTTLIEEYEQLLANLPEGMREEVQSWVTEIVAQAANTLRTNFISYVQGVGNFLIDSVFSVVNTVSFLLGFFLIPFWLFYVLMDQQEGRDQLDRFLPSWIRTDFWTVLTIIDYDFSGYLRGQLLLGTAVGSAAGIGLLALNLVGLEIPYVLLLAVIAGVTELVPIIGPILGSIPAILLGFLDSPTAGIAVLILYVVIQQLENNFLVPRIVGESVGLHPAILMILLVVGAQVFGIIGAILSAPVGAVARDTFSYIYGRLKEPPREAGLLPTRMQLAGVPLLVLGSQTRSVPEPAPAEVEAAEVEAAEDDKEA